MGGKSRAIEQQAPLAQAGTGPRGATRPPDIHRYLEKRSVGVPAERATHRDQSPLPRAVRSNAHADPHYK